MFDILSHRGHEKVFYHYDKSTGLKSIIALHDTTLGPAIGGVRILDYQNNSEALEDVLRLSSGMTFKAAYAGIDSGGSKAIIIGNVKKIKNEALLRSFGRFVESLGGIYITGPDVNTSSYDLAIIAKETRYAAGLPIYCGGVGDPSEFTAYGVYMGMKAAVKYLYGLDTLKKKKVLIQGIGKVGRYLIANLAKEDIDMYVTDINPTIIEEVTKKYNVTGVAVKDIYNLDIDIYSPCALGGTLNRNTIKKLKCKIIAGGANNQLKDPVEDDRLLYDKNILYVPDFALNTGGLIAAYSEYIGNHNKNNIFEQLEKVYERCLYLFEKSFDMNMPTNLVAEHLCKQRINSIRKAGLSYSQPTIC